LKCWAETYCKQYNTDICNTDCVGYNQLKFLYRTSNIPKRYQYLQHLELHNLDKDKQKKLEEIKGNIKEYVDEGKGLMLISQNKGNGKTSWACILMNAYFKEVALKNNLRVRGKFVSVPEFLQNLKDDFDRDEKEMEKFKKHIKQADLVIWDDIGAEMPTKWAKEVLYNYINYRISNNLSQIYTSNKEVDQLEEMLGERIYSRMKGQSLGMRFASPDIRKEGK